MSLEYKQLVSIVVPVYNVEDYLEDCIKSILSQTYDNIEILLIDDGSEDSSGVICDKYANADARIKVVHKVNGGLSSARNKGIDVATGKYITFVDSDDIIAPNTIQNLYSTMVEQDSSIVKMKMTNDINKLDIYINSQNKIHTAVEYLKEICTYKASVSFCDKLFKKSVFDFQRFKEGVLNEDLLLLCSLLIEKKYQITEIEYTGYFYRQRENSTTKKRFGQSLQDSVKNCAYLVDLSARIMPEINIYFRQLMLYQSMCYFIEMPEQYIKDNNDGYQYIKKIFRENRKHINHAFFSIKNKVYIYLCIFSPQLAKWVEHYLRLQRLI